MIPTARHMAHVIADHGDAVNDAAMLADVIPCIVREADDARAMRDACAAIGLDDFAGHITDRLADADALVVDLQRRAVAR